jgi:hypothetical protein
MNTDLSILEGIGDDKPVRIFLPVANSHEMARLDGLYRRTDPPRFTLLFKAGVLPEGIDLARGAFITVDQGGRAVSLQARIVAVPDGQTVELHLEKSVNHEQLREYFRVDASTEVVCKPLPWQGEKDKGWAIVGQTVDISGSGVLAVFDEPPPANQNHCWLEITLPGVNQVITAMASRVRSHRRRDNRYEVAYHFDDISSENRDAIIGCCLTLQRKQLQLRVRVKGR